MEDRVSNAENRYMEEKAINEEKVRRMAWAKAWLRRRLKSQKRRELKNSWMKVEKKDVKELHSLYLQLYLDRNAKNMNLRTRPTDPGAHTV